jgi:hypothetical protein
VIYFLGGKKGSHKKMAAFGMLRRVALVRTNVSQELLISSQCASVASYG